MEDKVSIVGTVKVQILGDIALFAIDNRKFRIRGKSKIRFWQAHMGKVIIHICPARFLIRSHHKANPLGNWQSQILDDFQAVVTSHGRPLVIRSPTSIELAINDLRLIRIGLPSASSWHHVQVGKDAQFFLSLTKGKMPGIIIDISSLIAIAFSHFKEFFQGQDRPRPKWVLLIRQAIIPLGVDGQQAEQIRHHGLSALVYFCFKID